jgi:hypothetical protein
MTGLTAMEVATIGTSLPLALLLGALLGWAGRPRP